MHDKSTQHRFVQASNRYILLLPFISVISTYGLGPLYVYVHVCIYIKYSKAIY